MARNSRSSPARRRSGLRRWLVVGAIVLVSGVVGFALWFSILFPQPRLEIRNVGATPLRQLRVELGPRRVEAGSLAPGARWSTSLVCDEGQDVTVVWTTASGEEVARRLDHYCGAAPGGPGRELHIDDRTVHVDRTTDRAR